jgi:hypothetical protein
MLRSVYYQSSSVPSLSESALLAPGTEAQPPEPAHKLSTVFRQILYKTRIFPLKKWVVTLKSYTVLFF